MEDVANSRMDLDAAAASFPDVGPPDEWDECFLSKHTESDRLSCFEALPTEAVKRIILSSPSTSCCLDPLPTTKKILPTLLTPLTSIVNLFFSSGRFPSAWKHALISPLLEKPSLDPNLLAHYRPIAFLPFASKLIERAAAFQLNEHLSTHIVDLHTSLPTGLATPSRRSSSRLPTTSSWLQTKVTPAYSSFLT